MMLVMFAVNLIAAVSVVTLAMNYLRRATGNVIKELCHTDAAAQFWLRSTDVLAYSGVLAVVLMFDDSGVSDPIDNLRRTLIVTFIGLFFTVLLAAKNIWGRVGQDVVSPRGV